jgi:hypothetical protein
MTATGLTVGHTVPSARRGRSRAEAFAWYRNGRSYSGDHSLAGKNRDAVPVSE